MGRVAFFSVELLQIYERAMLACAREPGTYLVGNKTIRKSFLLRYGTAPTAVKNVRGTKNKQCLHVLTAREN